MSSRYNSLTNRYANKPEKSETHLDYRHRPAAATSSRLNFATRLHHHITVTSSTISLSSTSHRLIHCHYLVEKIDSIGDVFFFLISHLSFKNILQYFSILNLNWWWCQFNHQPLCCSLKRLNHSSTNLIKSKRCLNLDHENDLMNISTKFSSKGALWTWISFDSIMSLIKWITLWLS